MHRGVVLDISESELVLLTPDGQFRKIPRTGRTCRIGEEILFTAPPSLLKRRPWLSAMLALTAAVVFCFVIFSGLSGSLEGAKPIVAYVTLDINPSVEFGIDIDGNVRVARGLNPHGAGLLEGLTMQGIPLAAATEQLMAKVEEQGYLSGTEGDVIISSTKAYEKADIDEESLGQIVQTTVAKHIETKHPEIASNVQVAAFVTPPTIREEAISHGVSAGKYAVYLSAKDNGNDVQLDKLKNESVHTIAKAAGGWSQLLNSENLPKKEALSKLLDAERAGELDAKIKGKSGIAETNESDGEAKGTIKPGAISSARADRDSQTSERSGNDRSSDRSSDRTGRTEQDGKDERNSPGNRSNGSSRQDDDRGPGRDDADNRGQGNERLGNNGQQSGNSSGRGSQDNNRNEPIRQGNAGSSNNQGSQNRQGSQNQGSQGPGNRNESSPNQGVQNQNNQNRGDSNQGNRAGGEDQTPLKPVQTSNNGQDRGKQEEERKNQEDARKKQEEERKKQEEERKKREDEQKKQEEQRGKDQQAKKQEEERKKQEELRKKQEEERKKQEEQKKREERERQEQQRNKQEELRKKQEEERRKQEQQRRDS